MFSKILSYYHKLKKIKISIKLINLDPVLITLISKLVLMIREFRNILTNKQLNLIKITMIPNL